jgi:hypothetical protein
MSRHHTRPTNTEKPKASGPESLDLSSVAFGTKARSCDEFESTDRQTAKRVDEVGPHIEFLKAFGGVAESYLPTVAGEPRCPHEKRLKDLVEQVRQRIDAREERSKPPKGARVVDITDVLADQVRSGPIKDFKEFLDKAGVVPGKTCYFKFPDGTFSAARRRALENTTAANEVVWVETFAAVGHLHNLHFTERGTGLIFPIPDDVRGFFDPEVRIAVMPMIDKRKGRSLAEWKAESLVILQTAVHELEHGRGGKEYQARAAGDAYLHRTGVMPTAGDPERRLEAISLGWYGPDEYSAAVADTMRDLKVPALIVPARLSDSRVEVIPVPFLASVSVGTFVSEESMERGDGAEVLSYGLRVKGTAHPDGRSVWFRYEDSHLQHSQPIGEPLSDRILEETLRPDQLTLRIVLAEAISHRVAHESLRMAKLLQSEAPISEMMLGLTEKIASSFAHGDVHLAVREYVRSRGGAAVISHGTETVWINSLPEGITIRTADSVTIFFASPIHRGAALRIPLKDGDSYQRIADRVLEFERDIKAVDKLFGRRPGKSLWESIAVPHLTKGTLYLFPALESVAKK